MGVLPDNLVKEFVKITNDTPKIKTDTFMYATAKVDDFGNIKVIFDGAPEEQPATPCMATVIVFDNDRVLVMLKNRQAVITANLSNPTINASYLEAGDGVFTGSVRVLGSNEGIPQTVDISPGEGPAIEIIGGDSGLGTAASMEVNSDQISIMETDTSSEYPLNIRKTMHVSSSMIGFQDRINDLSSYFQADRVSMYGPGAYAIFNRYGVTTSSDARLKKDIEPISPDLALQLLPVKFRFKGDESIHYGFIAQDVQTVLPDAVHTTDGYLSLNYSELIAPILSLVQDLERRVEELESKCNSQLFD